jgi:hypothetical protein
MQILDLAALKKEDVGEQKKHLNLTLGAADAPRHLPPRTSKSPRNFLRSGPELLVADGNYLTDKCFQRLLQD